MIIAPHTSNPPAGCSDTFSVASILGLGITHSGMLCMGVFCINCSNVIDDYNVQDTSHLRAEKQ